MSDDSRREETGGDVPESEDPFEEFEKSADSDVSAEAIDDLFEPVEIADIDDEAVWEAILAEDGDNPGTDSKADRSGAVVPIERYCKRCEFFSKPPDVACTHPNTEIVELVGVDQFRVSNCPIVVQRGHEGAGFSDER